MVTVAQMRKLALALPEVEEKSHFAQPDFRVRNKIFAGLDREERVGNLKLTPELQAMVLSSSPDAFSPAAGFWGRSGWTHFKLAQIPAGELSELLRESYMLVAPKSLSGPLSLREKVRERASAPKKKKSARKR
jgi:hypothetical protein